MLTAIGDVMRRCYDRGWITTRDGNISLCRTNSKTLYITPSAWRKTIIHPEHIVKCKLVDGGVITPAGQAASGELHMHWIIQKDCSKTRAVVHVHATHIVAAMYAGWDLQEVARQFPEVNRYTRVGPNVPCLPATSRELGDVTGAHLGVGGDGSLLRVSPRCGPRPLGKPSGVWAAACAEPRYCTVCCTESGLASTDGVCFAARRGVCVCVCVCV